VTGYSTNLEKLEFPRLDPDTEDSCPYPMQELQEYLKLEDGDWIGIPNSDGQADRKLDFLRTAAAFNSQYWIWEYRLQDSTHCYVTVDVRGSQICVGMDWGTQDLTPEQYIVDARRRRRNADGSAVE